MATVKAKEQTPQADTQLLPPDLLAMLKEWAANYKQVKVLEAQVKTLTERMTELEQPILDGLEIAEIERLSMDGLTIYEQTQLWAKTGEDATPQMVADALRKAKLAEFTTFNSQSLSSYVREIAAEHPDVEVKDLVKYLPKPLQAVVAISEKHALRARKSA